MRHIGRFLGVCVASYGAVKCVFITANGEWNDVKYDLYKHTVNRVFPRKNEKKQKVVVLGSGWAALSVIQKLDERMVDVTVVSPRSFFFYTPLLAGISTGTVSHSSISEPIRWHTSRFGEGCYVQAECTDVDFSAKEITCRGEGDKEMRLSYNHLVIAVGAESATFGIPGVDKHAVFMKEIEDGLTVQKRVLQSLEFANYLAASGADDSEVARALHWVVVGGGPTGVELTAELGDFINADVAKYFPHLKDKVHVTLVEATGKILGTFDPHISAYAKHSLVEQGATVLCDAMVTSVSDNKVMLKERTSDGAEVSKSIDYGVFVWAGGIAARPITRKFATAIGGEQVPSGRAVRGLVVDERFRVKGVSDGSVWAIGDCALSGCAPTAQAAYQQGTYLGRMLRDCEMDPARIESYPKFEMVNYGSLAYVGASRGVAELKTVLWDKHPAKSVGQGQGGENTVVEGSGAFAIWRSLYFSKLLSQRNKAQVGFDWAKTGVFGRDISSPYNLRISDATQKSTK